MDRSQKADSVAQLNAVFNEAGVVVVTRNLGLSVGQSTDLRAKMREAGASYKVAKNRLARLALKDTDYNGLEDLLIGPTALAYSADPVAAAKAAVDFAKTNDRLEIVGGAMGRDQGARLDAFARRAARQDRRPDQRSGDQGRPVGQCPGEQAGACFRGLCGQGSGVSGFFKREFHRAAITPGPSIRSEASWPISPSLLKNCRS